MSMFGTSESHVLGETKLGKMELNGIPNSQSKFCAAVLSVSFQNIIPRVSTWLSKCSPFKVIIQGNI